MHRGYVKLWRKSLDTRIWGNPELWMVWTWCLMKANHSEKRWEMVKTGKGKTEVCVGRGQFIFGRSSAAKELGMKPSTVLDRMKKLERCQNLVMQPDTHYTLVTINNWELYDQNEIPTQQATRQPSDNHPTTIRQPSDTTKNVKNVKNNKKHIGGGVSASTRFTPPSLLDVTAYCLKRQNGIKAADFLDYYQARGWKLNNGVAMKDWQAAVRTWESRRKEHGADTTTRGPAIAEGDDYAN